VTTQLGLEKESWVAAAHTCNPSYSGGRGQEDLGSKPAQANRSYLRKKPVTKKRAGGVAQGVDPEFKPHNHKKKKKKKRKKKEEKERERGLSEQPVRGERGEEAKYRSIQPGLEEKGYRLTMGGNGTVVGAHTSQAGLCKMGPCFSVILTPNASQSSSVALGQYHQTTRKEAQQEPTMDLSTISLWIQASLSLASLKNLLSLSACTGISTQSSPSRPSLGKAPPVPTFCITFICPFLKYKQFGMGV
jgi:hypothetical protein